MRNKKTNYKNLILKTIISIMIVFMLFPPVFAAKDNCVDLTSQLTYNTNTSKWAGSILDDNYMSYWWINSSAYKYIQLECNEYVKYIYVCYIFKPSQLAIQTSEDGETWTDIAYETNDEFYHVTYTFDTPAKFIRIKGTEESVGKFGVCEVKAYSEGILPSNVQSWLPAYKNPDMLIFSAHPDDEAVFFAGLIPYYSSEKGKKVQMVYMAVSAEYRHSEVLNYLWNMHQNRLPIYGGFPDVYDMDSYSYTKSVWGEQKTIDFMVSTIREKKPDVVVSHDIKGEYGHGAHMFTALCLQKAVELAADPEYHTESFEQFGVHQVKKLYLHLYGENQIYLDVLDTPLEEFDGQTAIEVAKEGILQYASQLMFEVVRVHDETSPFSCYRYGLAYTSVGYDTASNDMFENVDPLPTATPAPTNSPTPYITAEPTVRTSPTPVYSAEREPDEKVNINKNWITIISAVLLIILVLFLIIILLLKRSSSKAKH
ncbi:MAG: PIG-L family deacetylase [Eubacteriales bacterium]